MGFVKNKLKRKIIAFLTPVLIHIIIIVIVVGVVLGTVDAISGWWDNVTNTIANSWDNMVDFVTGEQSKREAALNLYDDLGLEYEGVIYKRDILEKIVKAPYQVNAEDINNKNITIEVLENCRYYYDDRTEEETNYPTQDITLSYNHLRKYVLDWQILYAVNYLIDTFELKSLSEQDVEDAFEKNKNSSGTNENEEEDIKFIKTNKNRIDKIIKQLKTKISYEYDFSRNKNEYSYNEIINNMPVYKYTYSNKFYNPNYPGKEGEDEFEYAKFDRTTLIPQVAPSNIRTCLYEYKYEYDYRSVYSIDNGQPNYILKNVIVKENINTIISVLEEYEFDESLVELLILIVEGLPDGKYIAQDMRSALYDYYECDYSQKFNPNIPHIEGKWSRNDLINTALSLQGLNYFWGGKYRNYGANSLWGTMQKVTSKGSINTGKYVPYGLDCSGFVEWAYYQMLGYSVSNNGGSVSLWDQSYSITRLELLPGDIGFYKYGGGKHVGIYIGKIDGVDAFVHAGGSRWGDKSHPNGQVIVTLQNKNYKGYRGSNFVFFRRLPVKFNGDDFWKESD
ncbi:C40 family peptidase [Vallitalea guaymasensis]|uniref:C40 family peptidase n=1 Tax=Vallitalea guaymasensis TaxID=1185412 RepID=UPI000DE27896|nr:NlpC/P60 family protein [Vallitalea guaymasensis]